MPCCLVKWCKNRTCNKSLKQEAEEKNNED